MGYRVIAFDLDDTLAVSKSRIDDEMADLLVRLLGEIDVCIISGGRFEQFETQVLRHLSIPLNLRPRLHLMPTCGTPVLPVGRRRLVPGLCRGTFRRISGMRSWPY